jgi:AAA15 family ATPase/GTPase
MHIRRIEIQNIRSIKHLAWELPETQDGAGWHVILGDNGSGKTTFVRSVSVCFIDEVRDLGSLEQEWLKWPAIQDEKSYVDVVFEKHNNYDLVNLDTSTEVYMKILKEKYIRYEFIIKDSKLFSNQRLVTNRNFAQKELDIPFTEITIQGAFLSAFGASRIFSNYNKDRVLSNMSSRIIHAFINGFPLNESLSWLRELYFKEIEQGKESSFSKTLKVVTNFVNQSGFLAHDAQIDKITSDGVSIKDGNGNEVSIDEMSGGYHSVLSLTLELIRQLIQCYGLEKVFHPKDPTKIICPGVVQIDEVDAHLHPTWQERIGYWFKKHFPNIQFIVTTHSPLICWAADSVFVLPTPGTEEVGRFLRPDELNRVKYGSVQEGYMLAAFGEIDRSEEGYEKRKRLTELNGKEWDGNITEQEKAEQEELRVALPLSALSMK